MKKLKTVAYVDDLADTKTIDGHHLKPHLLFRSANLAEIDENDLNILLNDYQVDEVIDLRTNEELEYRPEKEKLLDKVIYHHIPLLTEEINPVVTKENRIQVLYDLVNGEGGMRGHIFRLYNIVITSQQAIDGYKKIFDLLLKSEDEQGFLFHCTQGKDRTGMTLLLILTALGVSKEEIIKIYLSFNKRARLKRMMYFLGMNIRFSMKKAIALNDTLTARKPYIRYAYQVFEEYGGVDSYLKDVIGLTEEDKNKLKNKFLTK